LFAVLTAALLYFFRFGYDFARSDQDEFLPSLLQHLNSGLFENDWFVQSQAAHFGVRTLFVGLIESVSSFAPVWLSVLGLYLVAWLLLATAVFAVADAISRDRTVAAATVIVALVFTPHWTLGGNDLVHSMLVPSMFGWGLGLWGVGLYLKERHVWAGLLLGFAVWMQALVGLQLALILFLVQLSGLWDGASRRDNFRALVRYSFAFGLIAMPIVGLLATRHLGSPSSIESEDGLTVFYIMAVFRAPHHYLFQAFSTASLVRFGALAALGISFLFSPTIRRQTPGTPFVLRTLSVIALLCTLGYVSTELWQFLIVAKLQLFKTTVLAKLILIVVIVNSISFMLPVRVMGKVRKWVGHPGPAFFILMLWTVVMVGVATDKQIMMVHIEPVARIGSPMERLEHWVRTQSPREAVFAVPPSFSAFRSNAQRAIVVNFKAFPFADEQIPEWFRRISDFSGGSLPPRGGPEIERVLDQNFEALSPRQIISLADRYDFSYLVRATPFDRPVAGLKEVYRNPDWVVYRVSTANGK